VITLSALTILLPLAAAFAGMLLGPVLTRALRARAAGAAPGDDLRVILEEEPETEPGGARSPLRDGPALIAVVPMAVATLLSLIVAITVWQAPGVRQGTLTLIPTGTVPIAVGLQVDGLAAAVAVMVCCVALAVQVYSVAYMAADRRYSSYAAFVSLFTAAMLLVVFAGDLLLLYVGWEIMGVCSYFLIGHHWEDRANSRAAVKAFLVTRIGDVGFLLGIFVLGIGTGTFEIDKVIGLAGGLPRGTVLAGALLLLAGVAGKSAQFPLHTWLPDAMAGPTPISALIHAATMVAAGVYVVARLYPVFLAAPAALAVLGIMAAISMLGAALAALAQSDLKRVLAYSTISQLAYMAAGLAVGTRDGAIFHLLTHGAFKALLFLSAGCVIVVAGSNLLRDYGGLRPAMPVTFWAMTIGYAALAGIPPASGFFSKDTIIEAAQQAALHGGERFAVATARPVTVGSIFPGGRPGVAPALPGPVTWIVYLTLLVTVAVTAAYATRAWLMTFFGKPRSALEPGPAVGSGPAAEAASAVGAGFAHSVAGPRVLPRLMSVPVVLLAAAALVLGFFGLGAAELRPHLGSAVLALLCAVAGAGGAFAIWNRDPAADPARALGPAQVVFARAFFVDDVYAALIVAPVRALARAVVRVDDGAIDAAVEGSGRAARRLGGLLRSPQNGNPQAYLTGVLAGMAIIVLAVVIFV
jgi:NADH-quinone oxidoreductase subunit L